MWKRSKCAAAALDIIWRPAEALKKGEEASSRSMKAYRAREILGMIYEVILRLVAGKKLVTCELSSQS